MDEVGADTPDEKPAKCENQTISDIAFTTEHCNIEIGPNDWNVTTRLPVYPAMADVFYSNNVRYRLELSTIENLEHYIWSNYLLEPITVSFSV